MINWLTVSRHNLSWPRISGSVWVHPGNAPNPFKYSFCLCHRFSLVFIHFQLYLSFKSHIRDTSVFKFGKLYCNFSRQKKTAKLCNLIFGLKMTCRSPRSQVKVPAQDLPASRSSAGLAKAGDASSLRLEVNLWYSNCLATQWIKKLGLI